MGVLMLCAVLCVRKGKDLKFVLRNNGTIIILSVQEEYRYDGRVIFLGSAILLCSKMLETRVTRIHQMKFNETK